MLGALMGGPLDALPGPLAPSALHGQDPPVTALPDSLQLEGDEAVDTAVFHRAPELVKGAGEGFGMAVWSWDREKILSSRALTLDELLRDVSGVVRVRAGDFGMPRSLSFIGGGAGTVRVFRDGFEVFPLRGGVEDLSLIGLSGVEEVRVDRFLSEIHIRITSVEPGDVRPLSMIETGQGDFNTNLFRGMLLLPNALGGSVTAAIDRVDTRGSRGEESGVIQGVYAKYGRYFGDNTAVSVEYRTRSADRDTLFSPGKITRADLTFRGSRQLGEGIVMALGYSRSSLEVAAGSGDVEVDSLVATEPSLTQAIGRLSVDRGPVSALLEARWMDGRGAPSTSGRLGFGLERPDFGSVWVEGDYRAGDVESAFTSRALFQTTRVAGVSGFASIEKGETPTTETRFFRELEPAEGEGDATEPLFPFVTTRDGLRVGADFQRWGATIGGAWLSLESSNSIPLGLIPAEAGVLLGPSTLTGLEFNVSVPLHFDGLRATGMITQWEEPEGMYLPAEQFVGALQYHNVFRDGVLELWLDSGAEGRDGMLVPSFQAEGDPMLERVPYHINYFGRLQLRIATLRIYMNWDNLTYREMDADLPGRFLPSARVLWGVRWTLWS